MQKKAEDRRCRGNQSLAHGDILFERYVCGSGEGCTLFTHSREAPSLVNRVEDTDLPGGCPEVVLKLWGMVYHFVTGLDGKGVRTSSQHLLSKVTRELISQFKMCMSLIFVSAF